MGIGFRLDWRYALPAQSHATAASASTRSHQQQHPTSLVGGRDTSFETTRMSILHSIQEESEVPHTHILTSYTNSLGVSPKVSRNCMKMEEVNADFKHGGSHKFSGMFDNKPIKDMLSSCNVSTFSLLMENLDEIENILVDSELVRLERDILVHVKRLGVLKVFNTCLSRTYKIPVSLSLAFPITGPRGYFINFPANDPMTNIAVTSRRKKERRLRRQRASEKTAKTSSLAPSLKIIHEDRSGIVSSVTDLTRTYSKSRSKRHSLAKNEANMSMGVKDVAKLEKARMELEKRTGKKASLLSWAQLAETDAKTLQHRLHYGWYCKDRLLKSTRPLVIYLARSYRGMGIAFDDLIQAGNIGALRGAERFDPSRGYKFSTYVQYWIRKSMSSLVARHSRVIHIPATMEKAIKQLQNARRTLSSTDRRCLQDVEVAEFTGLSLAKVRLARKCARSVGSIDQKVGEALNIIVTEVTPNTSIPTPEETVTRQLMRKDIDKLLGSLPPRERRVLLLRYGFVDGRRMSLEEIGRLLHVSKEWVRKLEISALTKVRKEEIQEELRHYLHLHFT
uniref:RNA polymerase sigma factor rpoD n=1 Tax=Anthurium amnicola TaxID=1678845 RepID=A0A1D1XNI7_9ARAE